MDEISQDPKLDFRFPRVITRKAAWSSPSRSPAAGASTGTAPGGSSAG